MQTQQDISLRSEEEEMQSIWNLLFQLINPTNINDMEWEWDIMQAILLALNAHSTCQESGCQAMHKQEAQNMVAISCMKYRCCVCNCHIGEKLGNRFKKYSHLTLCITLQSPCSCVIA